jgi:hypothetical protein
MESKSDQLRAQLKGQIDRETRFTPWMLILASVVLPILEAILVNLWTGAKLTGPAGPCLAVIGIFHLVIGGMLIWNEFRSKSPLRVLADAADLADANCSTQLELDRRVQTYRMFRDAIEEMNAQVCSIQTTGEAFEVTLRPVIKRFLNSICETIGVCSNRYTLEVYLYANLLLEETAYPRLGDYVLAFFDSPTLQREDAIQMGSVHPLWISAATSHERMIGRVSTNPGLFTRGGHTEGKPYFEQYATHVIPTQCRAGHLGYVVFTTTQTEPIASDALETLGLIASVTSSFHARWYDCQFARDLSAKNSQLLDQLLAASQPMVPQRPSAHIPAPNGVAPQPAAVIAGGGLPRQEPTKPSDS